MCFAEVKLRILGFQWWVRQKDHFAGVNVTFCKDTRPRLRRDDVFWPMGSQERWECSGKKKEPHTQPNANPSALLGRERLVNLWVFLSCYPIFSPTHLKEAWVGGDFSLWQICCADRLWKEVGQGAVEQVWKLLWPTEGSLKAWPSACRHNSGHNPTYALMKPHLWVEVAQPTAVLVQIKGPSTAASSVLQWSVEDAYRKCKTAANCSMSPSHTDPALSVSSLGSYLIGTSPL